MGIDYAALRGSVQAPQVPADGRHHATLDRAKLLETSRGERLVTEWSEADNRSQWESWNRFDQSGIEYTRELLQGLGIDLSIVTDDSALEDALAQAVGTEYDVTTKSSQGSQGDKWFVNTYVNGTPTGAQESLEDVPIDAQGLPDPKQVEPDDEKIPF